VNNIDLFQVVRRGDIGQFNDVFQVDDIDIENEFGQNLLHEAIASKKYSIAEKLISLGIDVNHQDNNGQTPLHYSAIHGDRKVAKIILENRGMLDIEDKYGNEPLWHAVFNARGKYDMVNLFMSGIPDVNHKNKNGKSPLDFARQIKDHHMVSLLTRGI